MACFIDNARWDGVPFLLKAGKALHSKRAEIRVQFRHVPGNLYKNRLGVDLDQTTNELVSSCLHVTFLLLLCHAGGTIAQVTGKSLPNHGQQSRLVKRDALSKVKFLSRGQRCPHTFRSSQDQLVLLQPGCYLQLIILICHENS